MRSSDDRFTEHWDAVDPFDSSYPHLWIKVEHLGRYLFAAEILKSSGAATVIDIGCGTGYGSRLIQEFGTRVTAVDVDLDLLEQIRRGTTDGIETSALDLGAERLSDHFTLDSFDAAVCFETLEHLTDPESLLREIHALLTTQGMMILSVPNSVFELADRTGLLNNSDHRRAYSISSITELLVSCRFRIIEVLGQAVASQTSRREARAIKNGLMSGRIGDEPALHEPETIRRLAMTIGYPEQRDIERSYSITVVARKQ